MEIRSVGIDLGKTSFHLVALGEKGKVLLKKTFTQKQLIAFTANMQTCLIGMNCSDQPDSRVPAGAGYRVRQEAEPIEGSHTVGDIGLLGGRV